MHEIRIQVHRDRKLSKKAVSIGQMQENRVTKLIFEMDEDIVALGGNAYLFVSYEGKTHPYPLTNGVFEVGRELTKRRKAEANIVVSSTDDIEKLMDNLAEEVMWISNTLLLTTDKNSINVDEINETELPPSLKVVYDELLELKKDLQKKKDEDYWRGPRGEPGNTPQRGIDYWTPEDIEVIKRECKSYVDEEILGGAS